MLREDLGPFGATLFLTSEITQESAIDLIERIRKLNDSYFYPEVDIEIASPGGEAAALFYCADALRPGAPFRVGVTTRVRTSASSAAAVLASLGDRRLASPRARLLYHTSRLMGIDHEVTADMAAALSRVIGQADTSIVELLVERARRAPRQVDRTNRTKVKQFRPTDWGVIAHLLGQAPKPGGRLPRGSLLKELRKAVDAALAAPESEALAALYGSLCALDVPISAHLAQELHLIDAVEEAAQPMPEENSERAGKPGVRVPEWSSIFRPGGHVPRDILCRHALILGETGSGKTASGILPVVSAILDEESPVGCALIVDPKHEIGDAALELDGAAVHVIDVQREEKPDIFDLMAGPLSVDKDLAKGRVMTAARKILCRAASLSANNPARLLAGKASTAREPYWESQGSRLAQTVLALVLILVDRRVAIFGSSDAPGALEGARSALRAACGKLGLLAGCLEKDELVGALAKKALCTLGTGKAPEVERTDFARDLREEFFYARHGLFAEEFEALKSAAPEPWSETAYRAATRELIAATAAAAVRLPEDLWVRKLGLNVLALADHALQLLFTLGSARSGSEEQPHGILATPLAEHLRATVVGGEIGATFEAITGHWNRLTGRNAQQHYGAIVAHARMCFYAFADRIPSRTLYFGCEPGLRVNRDPRSRHPNLVDFESAVDARTWKKCFVFRPQLRDDDETLIARSMKALFFEAVLNSKRRQKKGADMPLVAYVADEFHRFVTSDRIHGEQSFLDTCRSFGAFSVLACQSIASLRHALAEMSGPLGVERTGHRHPPDQHRQQVLFPVDGQGGAGVPGPDVPGGGGPAQGYRDPAAVDAQARRVLRRARRRAIRAPPARPVSDTSAAQGRSVTRCEASTRY